MTIYRKRLPIKSLEKIDDLCAEFEQNWISRKPQTIESVLESDLNDDEKELLLSELLVLEIDYRRKNGESPIAENYRERFPNYNHLIRNALRIAEQSKGAFTPPSLAEIAELFPSLEVISLLGAGGMGAVYKARQKDLDRIVALKILPEEFGHDVKFALRFTREARTLARLNHPNIVSVHEFGNVEDIYFILMEFVDGSTLRDTVQAGELKPKHALKIVPFLCDALQYAHDQGIVHRDIKPENILLAKDGSVKIADFGLSRMMNKENQATSLTQTNQVLGTPRYMAPEQFEASNHVDHRADIYSLGVVFYEMLTGELPMGRFEAPSHKVRLDVRLDEVVLRTLEKEPQRRYQAASHIKSDLDSISNQQSPEIHNAIAPTIAGSRELIGKDDFRVHPSSLAQQETAAKLLLSRRHLMDRVRLNLRPLCRGQIFQILIGVALIVLGAQCWAQNTNIVHRLVNGIIVHAYGIIVIGAAAHVLTRIGRMDYTKPVSEIRESLNRVRKARLLTGPVIGLPWWLMWLPVAVAMGFDVVMHPGCFWISLAVGIPGIAITGMILFWAMNSENAKENPWQKSLAGEGVSQADLTLKEIELANIE